MADFSPVMSVRAIRRFWSRVRIGGANECWEWQRRSRHKFGYGCVKLNGRLALAHRVSWFLTNGTIPDGIFVLHHCDNPACVNPSHLFIGSHADNMRDCFAKGRSSLPGHAGEDHPQALFTADQVREIRRRYRRRSTAHGSVALGREYGVHSSTIRKIVRGVRYGSVE